MDQLIDKVAEHVKKVFATDASGHDWWHIYRVWQNAKLINKTEKGDQLIVELGALLHDLDDFKFTVSGEPGSANSRNLLKSLEVPEKTIEAVCHIVENVSYKGAKVKNGISSLEGQIVQDADRLDALGAIGISRCFAYGGHSGRLIYDPSIKPVKHQTFAAYKNSQSTSINHFYEKLLLLKDKMNTQTGKKLAEQRHRFIETYLNQFFAEWQGKQ